MTDRSLRSAPPPEELEARLIQAARGFTYPPTPDLTRAVERLRERGPRSVLNVPRKHRSRRLALAGALLALLLAVLLAVPPVRAAVLDWIRLGAVRIFFVQPTATPTLVPSPTFLPGTATPTQPPLPTRTATPLASVLDLSGETSLETAQRMAGFTVRLPAGLGAPDRVYYQNMGGPLVILVWLDPARPGDVRLALFETDVEQIMFQKITPTQVAETTVNGRPAVWLEGPYLLITGRGDPDIARLIQSGRTLVWTEGSITYRLETSLELEEAVQIAESIR